MAQDEKRLAKPGAVVELIKGDYWKDDLSGINLIRGIYMMATTEQMKNDPNIARTGYIKLDKEIAPTAVIPDLPAEKLVRVEKALRLKVLKIFDAKSPTDYKVFDREKSTAKSSAEGVDDKKYTLLQDEQIENLLKLPLDKFEESIKKIKSEKLLISIYDAEYEGRNSTSDVRKAYIDTLQKYMKTKRERLVLSPIKETESETIKVEVPR